MESESREQTEWYLSDRLPTVEEVERDLILVTLDKYQGNRTKAARSLGVSIRTMRNKIRALRDQGYEIPGD